MMFFSCFFLAIFFGLLNIYSVQEVIPLGIIDLQHSAGVLADTNPKKNTFLVITPNRTYKIVAPSRHEMVEWTASIKNVISDLSSKNPTRSIQGTKLCGFDLLIHIHNRKSWSRLQGMFSWS